MTLYSGTIIDIDFDPEFGDITGTEATITVHLPYGFRYDNDPSRDIVIPVSKAMAGICELGTRFMVSDHRL